MIAPKRRAAVNGSTGERRKLGRGRSAVVYADRDEAGGPCALKVFIGDTLSNAMLAVLTGAPNPYRWCEDAIAAAVARRAVLQRLLIYWFDEAIRLPRGPVARWDDRHQAHAIRMELVDGAHAALMFAGRTQRVQQLHELVRHVMRPLQEKLIESGFDGMAWQAGLGNPVAAGNFMRHRDGRWVWIDCESGIPAILPLNALRLFTFYLPRSFRHGRLLFDDVDCDKLGTYLAEHDAALREALGAEEVTALLRDVDELDGAQARWKSLSRLERSVGYFHTTGRIDDEQAARAIAHPLSWYTRLFGYSARKLVVSGTRRAYRLVQKIAGLNWGLLAVNALRFLTSQHHRDLVAHRFVRRRIVAWHRRKFISSAEARGLRKQLDADASGSYISDFGVHLAVKPFVKLLQWWLLPMLFFTGVIGPLTFGLGILLGGMIVRTLYTLLRIAQAFALRRPRPWLALAVGLLPVIGNAAFPAQLMWSSSGRSGRLARFVLFDLFAQFGRSIPIWGGRDTLTEHWFNRLPLRLTWVRRLRARRVPPSLAATQPEAS